MMLFSDRHVFCKHTCHKYATQRQQNRRNFTQSPGFKSDYEIGYLNQIIVIILQAVDSNSLNVALDTWFEGLDVDRSGIFCICFASFCLHVFDPQMLFLDSLTFAEFQAGLAAQSRC
jgi:hypothetical protein